MEAVVGLSADGSFWTGDDVFGAEAPLGRIPRADRGALVRGLWHHARYNLPLRLVRRCRETALALRLRVLDAANVAMLEAEELHDPPLPEANPGPDGHVRYQLMDGQAVCFSVENRSRVPLYATLFNCAASGTVEMLGPTQLEVPALRRQTFWMQGHLGKPFPCRISTGRVSNVERLVVVGTTSPEVDVSYLEVRESFAEAISAARRTTRSDESEPRERWTAAAVSVSIVRG